MIAATVISALLALPLALASQSQTPNWRASSGSDGATNFIDTNSITRTGTKVRFWREARFVEIRSLSSGKRYDRLTSYVELDCTAKTMRAITNRVKLGEVLAVEAEGSEAPKPVLPGSTGMQDLQAACQNIWQPVR